MYVIYHAYIPKSRELGERASQKDLSLCPSLLS